MPFTFRSAIVVLVVWAMNCVCFAHDAWLGARWNANKSQFLVTPLIGEHFASGDPIKDHNRFLAPTAYVFGSVSLPLTSDTSDSTVLGAVPTTTNCVVSAGIKQREISYNDTVALEYLTEEIGLKKEEALTYLTQGTKEYTESYSRHLKTVISSGQATPRDSVLDVPLQIHLLSWHKGKKAAIRFRVLEAGKPIASAPIRVLSAGKSVIAIADKNGVAHANVDAVGPVLIAYIQLSKVSENRLRSVWTNLSIYRLQ